MPYTTLDAVSTAPTAPWARLATESMHWCMDSIGILLPLTKTDETIFRKIATTPDQRGDSWRGGGSTGSSIWQSKSSHGDWRDHLYTAFVDNLSKRVSRRALWEAFNIYGRVEDVFISFRNAKPTTFAFVRYKHEVEMRKAIELGNYRRIDGRCISVKKANFGWRDRRSVQNKKFFQECSLDNPSNPKSFKARVDRSYRDVVMGVGIEKEDEVLVGVAKGTLKGNFKSGEKEESYCFPEVIYNVEIPNIEMEWLDRSVICKLKEAVSIQMVTEFFKDAGFDCKLAPMGGVTVCATFSSKEERDGFVDKEQLCAEDYLDSCKIWNNSVAERDLAVWVNMEEVPLQLWNEQFFKSIGDCWGSFIRLDDCSASKKRLDIARMLVSVSSRLNIPSVVSVRVKEKSFKILVSMEVEGGSDFPEGKASEAVESGQNSTCVREVRNGRHAHNPFLDSVERGDLNSHGKNEVSNAWDDEPWFVSDLGYVAKEFSLMLSVEELAGCGWQRCVQDLVVTDNYEKCSPMPNLPFGDKDHVENEWALQVVNNLEGELDQGQECSNVNDLYGPMSHWALEDFPELDKVNGLRCENDPGCLAIVKCKSLLVACLLLY
ncbi:hypothetical protein PTKIN_Ptkin16aG0057100 [Pterospermum kingtungense]